MRTIGLVLAELFGDVVRQTARLVNEPLAAPMRSATAPRRPVARFERIRLGEHLAPRAAQRLGHAAQRVEGEASATGEDL